MKYLSQTKDVVGGAFVITGTRIPVSHIIFLLEQGHTYGSIGEMYPDIDVARIRSAVKEMKELLDDMPSTAYGQTPAQI